MAGTYGEPGKNTFAVPGVGGILSPVVNSNTGVTQVYRQGALGRFQSLGTYNPSTNKFTADTSANLTTTEINSLSNEKGIKTIKDSGQITVQKGVQSGGGSSAEGQAVSKKLFSPNKANTDPNGNKDAQTASNEAEINKELKKINERKSYDPLIIYPEKLQLKYQDCIKFSMLKYQQSFLNLGADATRSSLGQVQRSVSLNGNNVPTVGNRVPITTIVLPISGGINDSNTVDWQGNVLDEITKAFANIAQSTITKGAAGAEASSQAAANAAQTNVEGLKAFGASKLTELATGASGIMQRQYGAITNPNLELLFNGPQLRTFSFSFRLSPRSETEAKIVQKIIRYFKQGMTPKRSSGYLLLQSPHTFAISYLTADKEHPYLNKFKECALTQCNVNYTPDGNYMSYDGAERSMTSYEVTLQFQELVPLFDDDYSALDSDQDKVIGF